MVKCYYRQSRTVVVIIIVCIVETFISGMDEKPVDEDFFLVANDSSMWRFYAVPKLPTRICIFNSLRRHWSFVPMDVELLSEDLDCPHRWHRQSLFMWKGQLAMAICCVDFHLSFIYADMENRRWRRLAVQNSPELPGEIGNISLVASNNLAGDLLLSLFLKDHQNSLLFAYVFRDSSAPDGSPSITFDGDYILPQIFPGDILPPVALTTGPTEISPNEPLASAIFCLYKSQYGLIDRLVTFNLDSRGWSDGRPLTGWQDSLAMTIKINPESHDSPVVATVDDTNGVRIIFCSVDIQRPMWAFNICCLDVQSGCWSRLSRFYLEFFYAHQKINLALTPDGRLLVTVKYPWENIREIRLRVTPLQQLCWGSLITAHPNVGLLNFDQLRQLGLPQSFLMRNRLFDVNDY